MSAAGLPRRAREARAGGRDPPRVTGHLIGRSRKVCGEHEEVP